MFGGLGGINPAQMKAMMKQMGIKQEDIAAIRVTITCEDKNIVIEPASVQKITMQGQTNWQVSGEMREETKESEISDADVSLVAEKTGKNEDEARRVLEACGGDIAAAIIELSE